VRPLAQHGTDDFGLCDSEAPLRTESKAEYRTVVATEFLEREVGPMKIDLEQVS
jgi:hypothetical protein